MGLSTPHGQILNFLSICNIGDFLAFWSRSVLIELESILGLLIILLASDGFRVWKSGC